MQHSNKMVKTIEKHVVDAQTELKKIIFFQLVTYGRDAIGGGWFVTVRAMYEDGNVGYVEISLTTEQYTEAKFRSVFGGMDVNTLMDTEDDSMVGQIAANPAKFWGLSAQDMEKVVAA